MTRDEYRAYLKGDHWRAFRKVVLRDRPACKVCGKKATQVHHKDYSRLSFEGTEDVESLCGPCHEAIHKAHRENGIPLRRFDRAMSMIGPRPKSRGRLGRKARRKARRKEKRRLARQTQRQRTIASASAVPTSRLMSRVDEVARLLDSGVTTIGIAMQVRFPHDEVKAVVGWIESRDFGPHLDR